MTVRLAKGTVSRILRSPSHWIPTLQATRAMAPAGWWRHRPFLPLPAEDYWRFRLQTFQGGDGTTPPTPEEFLEVVEWFRAMREQRR
jgi:hypothetical protein